MTNLYWLHVSITLWKAYQSPGGMWKLLLPGNVLWTSDVQCKVPRTTMCLWNKGGHVSENWLSNWKQVVTCVSRFASGNTDCPCAEGIQCCYFICSQIFWNGCASLSECPVTCQKYILVFIVTLWVIIATRVLFALKGSKELLSHGPLAFVSVPNIVSYE